MYELILIGNLYLFIDIPLLHRMGQEILKRKDYYWEIGSHKIFCHDHTFKYLGNLSAQGCAYSCFILHGKIEPLLNDETDLYKRTIYLFCQDFYTTSKEKNNLELRK